MSVFSRIGIILGTTREGRFADTPAEWLLNIARERYGEDAAFELVDLRDYPMPFFDESRSPMMCPATNEVAQRWAAKLASLDGLVFITAEYNHSISAVLKNAIDHVYPELVRKPAAFLGYGNTGGARAIEHLRGVIAELQMASVKRSVHIGYGEFVGILTQGKTLADFPYLEDAAKAMLDDLMWWTRTLRAGREAIAA